MNREEFLRSIAVLTGGKTFGFPMTTVRPNGRHILGTRMDVDHWYRDSYVHAHASVAFKEDEVFLLEDQIEAVKPDAIQFHTHDLSLLRYFKETKFYEKHGFRTVATINHAGTWLGDLYDGSDKYSYRINADGSFAGRWDKKHLCLNSPGVDQEIIPRFYIDIPRKLKPSQVWIDEAVITINVCYCKFCKALYRKQYYNDPPTAITEGNWEEWEQWVSFHRESFKKWMEKVYLAIKSVNPNILVTFNHSYLVEQPEKPPYFIDNLSADILKNPLELGINARYAGSGELGFDLMPGLSTDRWAGISPKPIESIYNEIAIIVAHGGKWNVGEFPTKSMSGDKKRPADKYVELARKGVQFARERQAYCQHTKSINNVALMHSARTHYAHVIENLNNIRSEERLGITSDGTISKDVATKTNSRIYWPNNLPFSEGMIGAYEALIENHISFDIINESQFQQRFENYQLVILADQHRLEAETVTKLHKFVENGGNLLASGRTIASGLDRLFGIKAEGSSGTEVTATFNNGKTEVCKIWKLKVLDGEVAMNFDHSNNPAIVKRAVGKGRVIYIAADIFDTYCKHSGFSFSPIGDGNGLRALLGSLFAELSGEEMLQTKANPWVEVVLRKQEGNLLLHLIDRKLEWKQEKSNTPSTIEVSLALNQKPKRVAFQPGDKQISFSFDNDLLELRLAEEDIHPHRIIQIIK